ncbi:TonB-dependent Receptor Plug Domain [Dyadobacter sp. SG02]|uniref:TonB-dependent receptor n=1 Tax=Dyadobacter sp. SG02 TaxID=1855291 RepID=UPI0008B8732B|nr:TonB-dependent receptor [Dyadobacter sp. SG02]SEJ01574.1 TonB-dependent Receptor Plug Domain [Dyadobacter sp. SG02]
MISNAFTFKLILTAAGLLLALAVRAQTQIGGEVTGPLGEPVPGAHIRIKGSQSGTVADSLGNFSFVPALRGHQILVVSSLGFKTHQQAITIADSALTLSITLDAAANTLDAVTVSAGSFEASDKAKGASLTPIDAYTVAGNGGDISNALRSLPGAQQVGEREGLFVRGGTSEETRMFVDGTLMKNPNYASVPGIMQPARINLFLFKGVLFNTGGYSALYGQAMSSALILESIDLPEKSSASFSLFPSNLGAGFQHLSKSGRSSYGGGIAYSNQSLYNKVVPQRPDYYHGPEYTSANANFRLKTGKTGMLKAYVAFAESNIGMRNPDTDSASLRSDFRLKNPNIYGTVSYRTDLGPDWRLDAGIAYTFDKNTVRNRLLSENSEPIAIPHAPFSARNSDITLRSHFAQGRAVLTRNFAQNQALRFGAETFYFKDVQDFNGMATPLRDQLSALFIESDLHIGEHIAFRPGLRAEYSSLLRKAVAAPRASLGYRLGTGSQLNLAYGIFYQKPENRYLFQNLQHGFSRAEHYVLNYSKKANNRFFRTEIYYKKYRDLVKTYPDVGLGGDGYAQGFELFWRDKKTIRNLDYWLTYTYLDTKRNYLDYPEKIRPSFTSPHTFTIAVKRFFQEISTNVNVSYSYAAGRPYYDIRSGADAGTRIYDSGTTRPYNVLNLHVSKMMRFFKKSKFRDYSGFAFGANNVLGTKQVFGYTYAYNGQFRTPITLPATRFYFLGIFMSLGIDRTEDLLDQN